MAIAIRAKKSLTRRQFFGRVEIDGRSEVMTVTLKDVDNRSLWSVDIAPQPDARARRMPAEHI
jgi:alkaline phosphatase D